MRVHGRLGGERLPEPARLDAAVQFCRTSSGAPAVPAAETVEMYTFMAACDESKARGGAEVKLEEVLDAAKERAQVVLDRHWYKPATSAGRDHLGPAPALAVVSDARAAVITGEAIIAHHGAYVFPDSNAHRLGEAPQPLYSVGFYARDLWDTAENPEDEVVLDLWQSYLEPA